MAKPAKQPKPKWQGADGLLKSGLKLIGSKCSQMADSPRKRVYSVVPSGIKTYCEPFFGAGNLFVGQPAFENEFAGDTNYRPINYFKQMQANPTALWTAIQTQIDAPMSAERFADLCANAPESAFDGDKPNLEQAVWFYLISRYARNGIVRFNSDGVCNSSYCQEAFGRGLMTPGYFWKVYERIKHIEFHACDYIKLVNYVRMDPVRKPEETLFVFDPPYAATKDNPGTFRNYHGATFGPSDQERLRDLIYEMKDIGYKCILTINDTEVIRKLYDRPGTVLYDHSVHYACSNTTKGRGKRPELIICNFDPDQWRKTC